MWCAPVVVNVGIYRHGQIPRKQGSGRSSVLKKIIKYSVKDKQIFYGIKDSMFDSIALPQMLKYHFKNIV